jgi:phage baseplate assembly protein W
MARSDRYTELTDIEETYSDFLTNLNPHPVSGMLLRFVNEKAVTRSIRNLIMTNKGERLYQPDIGSDIRSLLFEPISPLTSNLINRFIQQTITRFEPRAKVIRVEAIPQEEQNRYVVTIVYMLINRPDPITTNITLQRVR